MKLIIAAVDFSPASLNAAYYAADLAVQINAELLLVNVVELPVTIAEFGESGYAWDKMIDSSEKELLTLRNELTKHVNNKIEINITVPVGSVAYSLQEEAKRERAFCIVMGSDSMTAAEHLLVKNHALAAIHSVSIPVLIVPHGMLFKDIRKVVLAADLQDFENSNTLNFLKEWLRIFKAKLDVVNVVESSQPPPETVTGSHTLQYELSEFDPEFHFIYESDLKQAIEGYIEQNHPDLLVTMPGKYGFFTGLFHKSQSKQLIRQPHIPVLSISE